MWTWCYLLASGLLHSFLIRWRSLFIGFFHTTTTFTRCSTTSMIFLTLGPPSSPVCQAHVDTSFTVFNHLGLPLNHEKCDGPATCLVFLGIELDSVTQIARLPAEKFNRSMSLLQSWSNKRTCHRQELESLIGLSNLPNCKTSGVDNIDTYLLNIASEVIAAPIRHILNCSFATSTFPDQWKIAKLRPIPKDRKNLLKMRTLVLLVC